MHLQRPSQIQTQKFGMNPRMYQSLKVAEMPVMDLRERIAEELDRNPALEVLEDSSVVSLEDAAKPPVEDGDFFRNFENSSDSGFVKKGGEDAADARRQFIEGALASPETLQEHLLWQLRLEPLEDRVRHLAEILIQNLDEDGFHKAPVGLLLKNEAPELVGEAVWVVRALDPVGTCTANYRESLEVQVELLPDPPRGIHRAISRLKFLEKGDAAGLAKRLRMSEEEAGRIFECLKELSPFPGRQFFSGDTRYVVPDIQVMKKEGEFVIILNEEEIPVLGINPFFMKMAGERAASKTKGRESGAGEDKPARDFARENIKEARWFINSINQRNHTLLRVSRAIVEFQRAFFMNGPKYLSPLTLKDIADEIDLHQATVSRTANGKYMQTEWGIFEIRHFFTNSISGQGSGGSLYSKEGVKEMIREIIETEDERLSDKAIAEFLSKKGISLARRTVAKYRNELDLESSFGR